MSVDAIELLERVITERNILTVLPVRNTEAYSILLYSKAIRTLVNHLVCGVTLSTQRADIDVPCGYVGCIVTHAEWATCGHQGCS